MHGVRTTLDRPVHGTTHAPGIQGPEGTPYEDGVFCLELELSERCVVDHDVGRASPLAFASARGRPGHMHDRPHTRSCKT